MAREKYDLEERLVSFSIKIVKLTEQFPRTSGATHLCNQIARSGSSPALNYAEAQSGESRNDFIHKMRLCLKELRETHVSLKIVANLGWFPKGALEADITECNELICIFVKSIQTSERNRDLNSSQIKRSGSH